MKNLRKSSLISLFCLFSMVVFAQPSHDWTFTTGGSAGIYNEGGMEIFTDHAGYIYTHGYFSGEANFQYGLDSVVISSEYDQYRSCYVAKYDSTGNNIWAFPINFADNQSFNFLDINIQMAVSSSGEIYILGANRNPLCDLDPNEGEVFIDPEYEQFLAKYNTNGEYLWSHGVDFYVESSIILDGDENIIITGELIEETDADPGDGEALIGKDSCISHFVAKYDLDGQYIWAFAEELSPAFPETFIAPGYRVANVDSENNIYILGEMHGTVDLDPGIDSFIIATPFTGTQCFLSKYTASGEFVWGHLWGSEEGALNACFARNLLIDQEDHLVISGYYSGASDFDFSDSSYILIASDPNADYDVHNYVAKYTADAEIIWAYDLNDDGNVAIISIALDQHNNIYSTGLLRKSTDLDPGPDSHIIEASGANIFIAKYTADLQYEWAFSMGGQESNGTAQERGHDIIIDKNDNIYATGKFSGTADFDPSPCVYHRTATVDFTNADIYIAKYTQNCTASNYPILMVDNDFACPEENIVIQVANYDELFNGNYWYLYQDSCGGLAIDSSEFGQFIVSPDESTTYYVVGEGCCFEEKNCDSISINVSDVVNATFEEITICDGDSTLIYGNYENEAQVYTNTFTTIDGCDSIHSIELILTTLTNTVSLFQNTINAQQDSADYQWYDCDTGLLIDGANGQSYSPEETGNYFVVISLDGCIAESNCVGVQIVSTASIDLLSQIEIRPNPVKDLLQIYSQLEGNDISYQVLDTKGSLIVRGVINNKHMTIDLNKFDSGVYFLRIQNEKESGTIKFVKI